MIEKLLAVSVGEIILKGKNRAFFEARLVNNIKRALSDFENIEIYKEAAKIYVHGNENRYPDMINRIKNVFGVVYVVETYRIYKDLDNIKEKIIKFLREYSYNKNFRTFKVEVKRADKSYPLNSPEIERIIGAEILKSMNHLKVDVHNPELYVYVDIKKYAYVYFNKVKGVGGMPIGTNGTGLLLLSGGIDSPVAGYLVAKRGLLINAVYFHSNPFTSKNAEEKVISLARILSRYTGKINLYKVNLLAAQTEIQEKCPESLMTIISRRFMMRIAEKIAKINNFHALITGESLGQVASQTIQGLNCTNNAVDALVLRPLIGMDKVDIIDIAREIETYETSILPYEDCCTVFVSKHPNTQPDLDLVLEKESILNIEYLINKCMDTIEIDHI